MSPVCRFATVLCLFPYVSVAILYPEHLRHQWARSSNPSTSSVSDALSNSSLASATSLPLSDRNVVVCNEARHVADLSIESCADALRQIPQDSVQRTWGQRGAGTYGVDLPQRYLGSRAGTLRMNDGEVLCAIDVVRRGPDYNLDLASSQEIHQAATDVFSNCVLGSLSHSATRSSGGVATGIGKLKHLAVEIHTYRLRTLSCSFPASAPQASSCERLLSDMPVDVIPLQFGPAGQPGVNVQLPQTLLSKDGNCAIEINTHVSNYTTTFNWNQVWEAAVAVHSICGRSGKSGRISGLGFNHMSIGVEIHSNPFLNGGVDITSPSLDAYAKAVNR